MDIGQLDHEFLWSVLEGALGAEKVAYLRHEALDTIVLNKMAQDYPEQTMPKYITLPSAMRHIAEKHAFARKRWQMVEDGISAIRQLSEQGLYKRAALLPRGDVLRKLAVRQRLLLAATGSEEARQKVAAILPEYDRQLAVSMESKSLEKLAGTLDSIGDAAKGVYRAVADNEVGGAALKGLGAAAGAAIPVGAVGYGLAEHAEDKARDMMVPMMAASAGSSLLGGLGEALGERLVGG